MLKLWKLKFALRVSWTTFPLGVLLILSSSYPRVGSLKYDENLKLDKNVIQFNTNFSEVLPLLTSTSTLCIFTENEELLPFLTMILTQFKTQIFYDLLQNDFKICDSIIAVGFYGSLNCSNTFTNVYTSNIYIFYSILETNMSNLQNCFSFVSSPEVVAISLSDDSVHELSPVFPRPRLFRKSSVTQVLKHRAHPKKLDLAGSSLPVATFHYVPFFIIKDWGKGEFDGIEEHVINEMSKHLNFSPSYLIYKSWGALMPNGTWVGQIGGAMEEGLAELAIGNLWQMYSLYTVMDFGPATSTTELGFLVRRPKKMDFKWSSVLTIFKVWVWLAILLSLVLVVIVYWAGVNWDLHSHTESWAGSIMTVFGHLVMTTSHCKVSDGNTRHTLTSWSVFSLLLTTSLSTGIVTRLTLPQYEARLDTIRQLVEGHFYWSVEYYLKFRPNQMMREFMFNFEDPWATAFENTYIHLETEDIINRTERDEKFAIPVEVYGDDVMVFNTDGLLEHKAINEFRLTKETFCHTLVSIGFKKKSLLIESLSVLNLRFFQAGLVDHWKDAVGRRWPQFDTTHLSEEHDIPTFGVPQPLLLDKLRPVFYLLLFGLAIASLVFVVEVSW